MSILEEFAEPTRSDALVKRYGWRWWTVALRGVAAIAFGVIALFAPSRALASLVIVFGVYALVDGVLALAMTLRGRVYQRGVLVVRGLVSLLAGLIALLAPALTALALLVVIAAWAIVAGVLEIAMAVRLHSKLEREWLLGVEGGLSIAFGIVLLVSPLAGAIVLGFWVGAYALVLGGMMLETGLRMRAYRDVLA